MLGMIAISPGFLKLGLVMLIIGSAIMGVVTKLRKLFTKNKKAFFLYTLICIVLFGLLGLLADNRVLENSLLGNLISFQIFFLIYGSLHVWVMRKFFTNICEKISDFWPEFFYTIVTTLLGLIGFLFVIQNFKQEYTLIFLASAICFNIPYLIVKLYEFGVAIPIPVFKKWTYPIDQNIKEPKDYELKNPRVISFEFHKEEGEKEIVNFRVKAPENMEFGRLFYFFLTDYNERHQESSIQLKNKQGTPYQWSFYSKPGLFGNRKHFDFDKTVAENNIKENDVILCQRV